jgi:CheY-like chemotaxis protein
LAGERRARVAVVDDDAEFVAMMEVLLEEEGMHFVRAPIGPAAVEGLVAAHADVAVLDLHGVANEGGLDLLRRIRGDPRLAGLPILVCSADIRLLRDSAADLAALPRVASIEKPFRIDALIGTLARLLAGRASYPPVPSGRPDRAAVTALEELLARIGADLEWSATDAWVPDTRPGMMRCAATWTSEPSLEPFAAVSRRIRLPYGGGLPGRVWASGRPTWAEDLASDLNFPRLATAQRVGLVSAAAVPAMDGDDVAGVIAGYAATPRPADPDALARLASVAAGATGLLRAAAGAKVG